jgi:hypothetical protein
LWSVAFAGTGLDATTESAGRVISGVTNSNTYNSFTMDPGESGGVQGLDALTDTNGKRFLLYMGWNPYVDQANAEPCDAQGCRAEWTTRPEASDVDERKEGFGSVVRLGGGAVYTGDIGEPLVTRVVSLESVPGGFVHKREGTFDENGPGSGDCSFEYLVWGWAARGELVRYYADRSANNTWTTTAMTTASQTFDINTTTGVSTGGHVCVDGEWMGVANVAGNTVTVRRSNPVAHPKYAPASTDFVGTYALAMDGGNINARRFAPSRRAPNQDRWDMEISLVRASWS